MSVSVDSQALSEIRLIGLVSSKNQTNFFFIQKQDPSKTFQKKQKTTSAYFEEKASTSTPHNTSSESPCEARILDTVVTYHRLKPEFGQLIH
jgi:hypothetical protein